jgi:hypothetical protein
VLRAVRARPRRLTETANRLILAPDERSLQADLVCTENLIRIDYATESPMACASLFPVAGAKSRERGAISG